MKGQSDLTYLILYPIQILCDQYFLFQVLPYHLNVNATLSSKCSTQRTLTLGDLNRVYNIELAKLVTCI